jgi:hypothetical protein
MVHFLVFCYILWTFAIVRGNLVYFSPFRYFIPRKSGNPALHPKTQPNLSLTYLT